MQWSQERVALTTRLQRNKNTLETMMKKMRAFGQLFFVVTVNTQLMLMLPVRLSLHPRPSERALAKARAREAEANAEKSLGQLSAQKRWQILVSQSVSQSVS